VNTEKICVMQECARGSLAGELTFPEVVGRLVAVGVERYHADYSRQEITYYLADGDSHVVAAPIHQSRLVAPYRRLHQALADTWFKSKPPKAVNERD
jgi:hypothetical protein